jgi:hypothetical protein
MENVRTLISGFRAYIKRGEDQRLRTANNKIATTTAKATQNKTHQQFRVATNYHGFSGTSTYTKLRRTLEKASDYSIVQVHDGFLGFSKHDSPEAKRKKRSVFFFRYQTGSAKRNCILAVHCV